MFEVPKPLSTLGISVDNIPEHIRLSRVLTGNDLGMLGYIDKKPTQEEVNDFAVSNPRAYGESEADIHRRAQEYLRNNEVSTVWKILMAK